MSPHLWLTWGEVRELTERPRRDALTLHFRGVSACPSSGDSGETPSLFINNTWGFSLSLHCVCLCSLSIPHSTFLTRVRRLTLWFLNITLHYITNIGLCVGPKTQWILLWLLLLKNFEQLFICSTVKSSTRDLKLINACTSTLSRLLSQDTATCTSLGSLDWECNENMDGIKRNI